MTNSVFHIVTDKIAQNGVVWASRLVVAVLIFIGFYIASLVVKRIIVGLERHTHSEKEQVLMLIGDLARIALLIFGAITALGTLGINVSALVAGLGLTGFALGFAFKDALSNVLAGVMILLYHPFRRGDTVKMADQEGEVVSIDLRYTTLQTAERRFLIPNSLLLTNAISVRHAPQPVEAASPGAISPKSVG